MGVGLLLVSESQMISVVPVAGRCRVWDLGGLLVSESKPSAAELLLLRDSRGGGLSVDSESKSSAAPRLDRAAGGGLALESESLEGIWLTAGGEGLARGETASRSTLDSESESTVSTRRRLYGRGRHGELSLDPESNISAPARACGAVAESGLDSESIFVSCVIAGTALASRGECVRTSGSDTASCRSMEFL